MPGLRTVGGLIPAGPPARINLAAQNPSGELGTTGWENVGYALGQSTDAPRYGAHSIVVATNGQADRLCAYGFVTWDQYRPAAVAGAVHTIGVDFRHDDTVARAVEIDYRFHDAAGNVILTVNGAPLPAIAPNTWVRYVAKTVPAPTGTATVRVVMRHLGVAQAAHCYLDGVTVEAADTDGSYFDGDTPTAAGTMYEWSGAWQASTSYARALPPALLDVDGVTWRTLGEVLPATNLIHNPAGRVTSGTVNVRTNLCPNPSFETSNAGWASGDSFGPIYTSSAAAVGTKSLAIPGVSAFYAGAAVAPATVHTVSAHLRSSIPNNRGGVYAVEAPAPVTALGPGVRYARAKNGPGLLVEEPTTNLILNPSFETDLTGWNANNGANASVVRDTTKGCVGAASMRVDYLTAGQGNHASGAVAASDAGIVPRPNQTYTASAWVFVPAGQSPVDISVNVGGVVTNGQASTVTNGWQRIAVTFSTTKSQQVTYLRVLNTTATVAGTGFYVDGVQLEAKGYATGYVDGSLGAGYSWDATTNLAGGANNPSFETDLAGWLGETSVTVTRDTTQAWAGVASLKSVVASTATNQRAVRNNWALTLAANTTYTLSFYVRAETGTVNVGASLLQGGVTVAGSGGTTYAVGTTWTRLVFTGTTTAAGGANFYIFHASDAAVGAAFFLDGVQFEAREYATPFGGAGAANASTSSRTAGGVQWAPAAAPLSAASLLATAKVNSVGNLQFLADVGNRPAVDSLRIFVSATGGVQAQLYAGNVNKGITPNAGVAAAGSTVTALATYDGATLTLCCSIDGGAPVTTSLAITGATFGDPPGTIAAGHNPFNTSNQINGTVESIALFNTVLSPSVVTAIVNGATAPTAAAARSDCVFSACTNDPAPSQSLNQMYWNRLSTTRLTTPRETRADIVALVDTPGGASTTTQLDAVLLERSGVAGPYFDGVMPAALRINYASNPSAEYTGERWGSAWGSGTGSTTRVTTGGWAGSSFIRGTVTAAPATLAGGNYQSGIPATAGKTYTASMYVRSSRAQVIVPSIEWQGSPGRISTISGAGVSVPANAWTRISVSGTAPDKTTSATFTAYVGTGGALWQVGDTIDSDGVLFEEGATLGSYFDGNYSGMYTDPNTAYGWFGAEHGSWSYQYATDFAYAWTGTADLSTSVQRAPGLPGFTHSTQTGVTFPYQRVEGGRPYVRYLTPAGAADTGWRVALIGLADLSSIQPGDTVTLIIKARVGGAVTSWSPSSLMIAEGNTSGGANFVWPGWGTVPLTTTWTEFRRTAVATTTPTGQAAVYLNLPQGASIADSWMDVEHVAVVKGEYEGPYFDGVGGPARINLAPNPDPATSLSGWTGRWFGGGGGSGGQTVVAAGGPLPGTGYTRKTWTAAPGGNGDTGFNVNRNSNGWPAQYYPCSPGDTITVSGYLRASTASKGFNARIYFYRGDNSTISTSGQPPIMSDPGVWTRVSYTAVAPAGAMYFVPMLDVGAPPGSTTWQPGDTLDGACALVEASGTLGSYFDGNTAAGGGELHRWSGVAGASPSYAEPVDYTYRWSGTVDGSASLASP